jgi:hypothetical protein
MPHNQCPPSRRGHSWREMIPADLPCLSAPPARIDPALRICKRCGTRGIVSPQGIVRLMETQ